jgi:hypothetical protein
MMDRARQSNRRCCPPACAVVPALAHLATSDGDSMDADRFDTLARVLSLGSSRRRGLAFLSGGLLGALALDRADDAAAKKKKRKKKKKKKNNSCDWFAGEEPCGQACCNSLLGEICCGKGNLWGCCANGKGCSPTSGLCTDCRPGTLVVNCVTQTCDVEGNITYGVLARGTGCLLDPGNPSSTTCPNGTRAICDGFGSCGCVNS